MQRARKICFGLSGVLGLVALAMIWCLPIVGPAAPDRVMLPRVDSFEEAPDQTIATVDLLVWTFLLVCVAATWRMERGRQDRAEPFVLLGGALIVASNGCTSMAGQIVAELRGILWQRLVLFEAGLILGGLGALFGVFGLLRMAFGSSARGAIIGIAAFVTPLTYQWWIYHWIVAPARAQPRSGYVVEDLAITPFDATVRHYDLSGNPWQVLELDLVDDHVVMYFESETVLEAELAPLMTRLFDEQSGWEMEGDRTTFVIRPSARLETGRVLDVIQVCRESGFTRLVLHSRTRPWAFAGAVLLQDTPEDTHLTPAHFELRTRTGESGAAQGFLSLEGGEAMPVSALVPPGRSSMRAAIVSVEPSVPWQNTARVIGCLSYQGRVRFVSLRELD